MRFKLVLAVLATVLPDRVQCSGPGPWRNFNEPSNIVGTGGSFSDATAVESFPDSLTAMLEEIANVQQQMASRMKSVERVLSRELSALSQCACSDRRSTPVLSSRCQTHLDCSSRLEGSVCSARGICVCDHGYWTEENVSCNRTVGETSACQDDRQCAGELVCYSGQCSCPVTDIGQYQYRLAGGPHCRRGRVELSYKRRAWGLVCDDYWDQPDAHVLCRSLGFESGAAQIEATQYGGEDNFYLDNVNCTGTEGSLRECRSAAWGSENCEADEVAGVICHINNIP